ESPVPPAGARARPYGGRGVREPEPEPGVRCGLRPAGRRRAAVRCRLPRGPRPGRSPRRLPGRLRDLLERGARAAAPPAVRVRRARAPPLRSRGGAVPDDRGSSVHDGGAPATIAAVIRELL